MLGRRIKGSIMRTWTLPKKLSLLAAVAAMAVLMTTAPVAAQSAPQQDFFGVLISIGEDSLVIRTGEQDVEVPITRDTLIRLPRTSEADLTNLEVGDALAISREEVDGRLVADKIFLIPGKTRHRHVPGIVLTITDSQITIQPRREGAEPIAFSITPDTVVRSRKGAPEVVEGTFVIVGAVRDLVTGQLKPNALAINVPKRQPARESVQPRQEGPERQLANWAKIRGVFKGVDESGAWIIGDRVIVVSPDTKVDGALVVGQLVEVEAELRSDGSLLAHEVDAARRHQVAKKIRLEGTFEGVDEQGRWIIDGTKVAVGHATDTDGLPAVGQRVRVSALQRKDGSLLGREIENKVTSKRHGRDSREVKLEGVFQGIDDDGRWVINGAKISVDHNTRLAGAPAVGHRVKIRAVRLKNGSIIARRVEGKLARPNQHKYNEAQIRGIVREVRDDGSLVVNGMVITLNDLTEVQGEPQVGDFVRVRGLLQKRGFLLARKLMIRGKAETGDVIESHKVEIEGIVEKVNEDGSLVVDGLTVMTSELSEIEGDTAQGASVEIEGVLQPNGSVLAAEIKGEGRRATKRGNEVRVEGTVEAVNRDDAGHISSLQVDGLTIAVQALTRVQGELLQGAEVRIQGILNDGVLLARHVRAKQDKDQRQRPSHVKIQGRIDHISRDDQGRVTVITVDGVPVALEVRAKVKHALQVGRLVELQGAIRRGRLVANKVDSEESKPEKKLVVQFTHRGVVDSVNRDGQGNIVSLKIDGRKLAVRPLTRIRGEIAEGQAVLVRGLFRNGRYLARHLVAINRSDLAKARTNLRNGVKDRDIKIDELVETVERDAQGRIIRIVLNGMDVSVRDLAKATLATPEEDCRNLHELTCLRRKLEDKRLESRGSATLDAETRSPAETRRKAEARIRADERRVLEAKRLAEEQREAEAKRLAEVKREEAQRLAEEEREAEAQRLAEEQREAEAKRLAEAEREAEAKRLAEAEREAEAKRLAETEREAEAKRLAEAERVAEAKRLAEAEREAEAKRLAEAEREAEAKRLAEAEREAEAKRLAEAEREAEAKKQADEERQEDGSSQTG